jgi:hypothetical protein
VTGWHAAIVCQRMASGAVEPSTHPVELAIDPFELLDELRQRRFDVQERTSKWRS